jgi:hypothetical protein
VTDYAGAERSYQQIEREGSTLDQAKVPMIRVAQLSDHFELLIGVNNVRTSHSSGAFGHGRYRMATEVEFVRAVLRRSLPGFACCDGRIDSSHGRSDQHNIPWPACVDQFVR